MEYINLEFCYCNYRVFCGILLYLPNKYTIYIKNIRFLNHSYVFRYLYIVLRQSVIVYAEVTNNLHENLHSNGSYKESIHYKY